MRKFFSKVKKVVDKELKKLDDKFDNPSHLNSSIPEKKEEAEVRFGFKDEKEQQVNEQPTLIETIVIESSNNNQEVINTQPIIVNQPKSIPELAKKYNVPFKGNFLNLKAQAGCPGIMNPLGETPEIELNWGFGMANEDKTHRYEQFEAALKLLENFGQESFKNEYIKLSIFGRAMLVHIASVQEVISCDEVLQAIAPYASEGLNLQEVPFSKGHGITVQKIFDQYVNEKTIIYLEDEKDIELEQALEKSLEESKLSEFKIAENNNQTQFNEQSQKKLSLTDNAKEILVNLNEHDFKYDFQSGFKAISFLIDTVGIDLAKEALLENKLPLEAKLKIQELIDNYILPGSQFDHKHTTDVGVISQQPVENLGKITEENTDNNDYHG